MRNPKHYRFRLDTVWGKDKEIEVVINAVKAHYQRSFGGKCLTILYAVFKPMAVALQTNSVIEVRKVIEVSRGQVEAFFTLALLSVSSGEPHPQDLALSEISQPTESPLPPESPNAIQPAESPREEIEELEVVDSAGSGTSLYASFEEDG